MSSRHADAESMVAPAENHSATLLIVDDDAAARDRLREIFETAQYRVVTANEAASALRVLKGVRCDLVALDLEMPGVDGLALCKLLRAQPTTSKLPIIALSESAMIGNLLVVGCARSSLQSASPST